MSEEIIKVLDKLGEKFGVAIDWTSQNIMPYIQELMERYIRYYTVSWSIWLTVELIFLIISIIVFTKGLKEKKSSERYWEWSDEGLSKMIFLIIVWSLLVILLPITVQSLLKSIFMPELLFIQAIGG